MKLPLIAVARGGFTGESVISHQSAARMMGAIDRSRYDALFVTITADAWACASADETPLPFDRGLFAVDRGQGWERFNGTLIAIHGSPGEDGLLQGYLDLLQVPYQTGGVGCMALTMSKYSTTAILRQSGFEAAPSVLLLKGMADAEARLATIGYPCFVKPDRSGSSLGISKVNAPNDLPFALEKAFAEGSAVMVEGAVTGRELTCGVIDLEGRAQALPVCEIRHSHEFFDYEAKYHARDTEELVPAPLPDEVTRLVQQRSAAIYELLECRGMARVDHIWTGDHLVTIEVNTTPGFSSASIFPKMLEVSRIGVEHAVNGLIARMLARG
ncbi:MAG: ATP-grasp domain-containing protein [Flavobacteriales bacterium]|nr:ATP-grasp domain-containing protein [Flavobacteriales bacterium]